MYFPQSWFSCITTTNASVRFLGESVTKERKKFQGKKKKNEGAKKGDQAENWEHLEFLGCCIFQVTWSKKNVNV